MNTIKMLEYELFQWDEGNVRKNEIKHGIYYKECEEIFIDEPIFLADIKHSVHEKRYHCIGFTVGKKMLFISFTKRSNKIRVISARKADNKERQDYEKIQKNS